MKSLFAAVGLLLAGSCVAPTVLAQGPTMDALWPNDDGRSWSYDLHVESYVPSSQVVDKTLRIFFDGTTVAPEGIAAQYLHQQTLGGTTSAPAVALASLVPDPFLRQVYDARPDLREAVLRAVSEGPCPANAPADDYAVLLGGEFAFRKTADEVAAWRCNLANTRSWQWLASNLSPGAAFTLQLIPDIASDIFLHGTVGASETVNVPAGSYEGCVRIDYVIDYGQGECTDVNGDPLGTFRSETDGSVWYAPNVGPVRSHETFGIVQATGGCPGLGVLSLADLQLNAMPVPVRRSSWGTLKAAYR